MPIDQVAELLVRWRGAGGVVGRARLVREGMQLLGGLDAAERRVLARSLAEQGAPELAARIEERTGGAMSAGQLRTVADGLLSMEDHQVDRLAASLRDPGERERLARQAVVQGMGSFDLRPRAASGHRARLDELPPPDGSSGGAAEDVDADGQGLSDPGLGDLELGGVELGGQELGGQELGVIELGDAGIVDVGIVDVGLHAPEAEPGAATRAPDPAIEDHEPARPVHLDGVTRDARSGSSAVPWPPAEDEARPVRPDGTGVEGQALLAALRKAESANARLRILDPGSLSRLDGATALAVLDALPDGWQRRRGALRLVAAGAFPTEQLAEALGRFARATDATFVAGALLAAGQVRAERFDGILSERVVNRLTARSER